MHQDLLSASPDAARERRRARAPGADDLLEALGDLTRQPLDPLEADTAFPALLARLGEAFAATRLSVVLELHDARARASHYQCRYTWVRPGRSTWQARGLSVMPAEQAVLFASVCRTGIGFQGSVAEVPSPQREVLSLLGTASLACAPFAAGQPRSGLLCLEDERQTRSWTRAEIHALGLAARHLGAALGQPDAGQSLLAERERAFELARANEALQRSVARVAEDLRVESLTGAFLAELVALLGAQDGTLMLRQDPDRDIFVPVAVHEGGRLLDPAAISSHPVFGRFTDLTAGDPLGVLAALSVGDAPSFDVNALRFSFPEAYAHKQALGHRRIWMLPLRLGGALLGFAGLALREERQPGPVLRDVATALAQQFALALELTRKAEQAQHAAVSREQQRSAQSRGAELARANRTLREAAARIAAATDLRSIATIFMREAVRASDASAAALFLERAGGFELAMLAHEGNFLDSQEVEAMPCTAAVFEASRNPDSSYFRSVRAGQAEWRFVDGPAAEWVPEALAYHIARGHQAVWDIPFSAEGKVIGYLGLAFRRIDSPIAIVTETVTALTHQISVGLELTALAARLRDSEVREAVSNERSRMARDIHDSLAQSFSSIAMQTEALLASVPAEAPWRRTLERIADTARLGIGEARATALALRPLDNRVGALDEALEALAHRCTVQGGMACRFQREGEPALLPLDVQEALLRIAQEAISNALRHSGGQRVDVVVAYADSEIRLAVQDDGRGLCADGQAVCGMGLRGMRQRTQELGGRFEARRARAQGTRIEVVLPLASGTAGT